MTGAIGQVAAQSIGIERLSGSRADGTPASSSAPATESAASTSRQVTGAQSNRPVEGSEKSGKPKGGGEELTEGEEKQVQELKKRDQEVRAHEQAHAAVGGPYAGAPQYEFTTGPDGKKYATSGEVKIDTSPVRDNPEATIRKMDVVIRAALAPAEPSSQDLAVARTAQEQRAQAQNDLVKERREELRGDSDEGPNTAPSDRPTNTSAASSDDVEGSGVSEATGSRDAAGAFAEADAAYQAAASLVQQATQAQASLFG